ncbi:MAG: 30S ribosomal protein S2 [Bacteroidia bacterium]|nr:30S ribosomal protein S2 [Bacteroidia bacterium]
MPRVSLESLLASGTHFGHLTRRWNPKMKPYIFMERNGIHIIDLKKTQEQLDEACAKVAQVISEGKRILFVGTKKQAKDIVRQAATESGQHYVVERWLGGMLTNFSTIRKSIKRLTNIEKMETDGTFEQITKKERLMISREKERLNKILSGIVDMSRLPGALFVVDIKKEHIAVKEANLLNIPVYAIVDTNCDPDNVDHVIPGNDDSARTIELMTKALVEAINEGKEQGRTMKAEQAAEEERIAKETDATDEEEEQQ